MLEFLKGKADRRKLQWLMNMTIAELDTILTELEEDKIKVVPKRRGRRGRARRQGFASMICMRIAARGLEVRQPASSKMIIEQKMALGGETESQLAKALCKSIASGARDRQGLQ